MRVKLPAMPRLASCRKRKPAEPEGPVDPEASYTVRLTGDDQSLDVVLSIPEPHEECPITMEPMGAPLEFLPPSVAFSVVNPRHTKMTMPCEHSFGALSLMYHMARNSMSCPMCRQGLHTTLNISSIPGHFRAELVAKVRRERDIQDEEDFDEFQQTQQAEIEEGMRNWRESLLSTTENGGGSVFCNFRHMNLLVCGTEAEADGSRSQPVLVNEFPLEVSLGPHDSLAFSLSMAHTRALSRNLRTTPRVSEFSLAISIRGYNGEVLRLDESPCFELGLDVPTRSMIIISRSQASNFEVKMLQGGEPKQFESLSWHVLASDLRTMFMRESFVAMPTQITSDLVLVVA